MIYYDQDFPVQEAIYFHRTDRKDVIALIERAVNTLSPPDPRWISILDGMKAQQAKDDE